MYPYTYNKPFWYHAQCNTLKLDHKGNGTVNKGLLIRSLRLWLKSQELQSLLQKHTGEHIIKIEIYKNDQVLETNVIIINDGVQSDMRPAAPDDFVPVYTEEGGDTQLVIFDEVTKQKLAIYNVHKEVLSTHSELFKDMLDEFDEIVLYMTENQIHLMDSCLSGMYDLSKIQSNALPLLVKFQMPQLAKHVLETKEVSWHDDQHLVENSYQLCYNTSFWTDTQSPMRSKILQSVIGEYMSDWLINNMQESDIIWYLENIDYHDDDDKAIHIIRWCTSHPTPSHIVNMINHIKVHNLSEPVRVWYCNKAAEVCGLDATKAMLKQLNSGHKFTHDNEQHKKEFKIHHSKLPHPKWRIAYDSDDDYSTNINPNYTYDECYDEYGDVCYTNPTPKMVFENIIDMNKDWNKYLQNIDWMFTVGGVYLVQDVGNTVYADIGLDCAVNVQAVLHMKTQKGRYVEVARYEGRLKEENMFAGNIDKYMADEGVEYGFRSKIVLHYVP